ncbi:unnamed protein product, partial [Meganyctiphanes norvegica]
MPAWVRGATVRRGADKTGSVAYLDWAPGSVESGAKRPESGALRSGLLGLTSLYGFGFFFLTGVLLWLLLLVKAGSQWEKYFVSRKTLLTSGLFSGVFTYVLFWTFFYGMVHVY